MEEDGSRFVLLDVRVEVWDDDVLVGLLKSTDDEIVVLKSSALLPNLKRGIMALFEPSLMLRIMLSAWLIISIPSSFSSSLIVLYSALLTLSFWSMSASKDSFGSRLLLFSPEKSDWKVVFFL